MTDPAQATFLKALSYIHTHLDAPIHLAEVAASAGASLTTLKRVFEEVVETTPGALIRRLRMEHAFRSLPRHDRGAAHVAEPPAAARQLFAMSCGTRAPASVTAEP